MSGSNDWTRLSEIESRIASLVAQIGPLTSELEALRREERRLISLRYIEANRIKREDVEMSDGDGKPYFGNLWAFAEWIKRNSKKSWAEWNQRIYQTSDLLAGRMPESPATINELP